MTVLAVASGKGGTGKTTTAVNLAAALVADGERVTLVDLDPQASATLGLGQAPSAEPFRHDSVALALDGFPPEGLRLRRAGRGLAFGGADDVRAHLAADRGASGLLVLDCPPGLGVLALAALEAADVVLVPLEASPLALQGLADVAAVLRGRDRPPLLRVALVRVNPRRQLTEDVRARIRADHPGALYRVEVPEDVRAAEAPGFGLPVTVYAPASRSAVAYRALARRVAGDLSTVGAV